MGRECRPVRFLSLFSGIEAASVAWVPLGWECVAVAEIDRFACELLAKRFPDVPNLGDVTKITREQIQALGHIDVVIAGFPCQDVSVAGKRAGLKGKDGKRTRSGLFHVARKLIRWSRARWAVLENVPGLFTSHDGRDFATVVGKMVGRQFSPPPGGWRNAGVAAGRLGLVEWATLDSQFFHVAQRRERVFLVRDAGAWADRPPVLLVPQSSLGNPPTRGEARAHVAGALTPSAARRGPGADPHSGGATLVAQPGEEVHPPLAAGGNSAGGGRRPGMSADDAQGLVAFTVFSQNGTATKDHAKPTEVAGSLDSNGGLSPGQGGTVITAPTLTAANDPSRSPQSAEVTAQYEAVEKALRQRAEDELIAYRKSRRAQTKDDDETWVDDGRANTLNAFDVGERDTHAVLAPVAVPDPAYAVTGGHTGGQFGTGRDAQDTFVLDVAEPIPFDPKQIAHPANHSSPKAGAPCHPLRAVANCEPAIAYQCHGSNVGPMGTLRAGNGNEAGGVPFLEADPVAFHTTQDPIDGPISPCLSQGNQQGHCTTGVLTQTRVRRLTPTECERLQGFPDGWTDIKRSLPNKKLRKHQLISPDGPRYRALGNSMTTSVIAWIGRQIDAAAKGAP